MAMSFTFRLGPNGTELREIIGLAAEIEHEGNDSALVRDAVEDHPTVKALRIAGQIKAAAEAAERLMAQEPDYSLTEFQYSVMRFLQRGSATLEGIVRSVGLVSRGRDPRQMIVTQGMLKQFVLKIIKLVRLGLVDCKGEALSGRWCLTERGRRLLATEEAFNE